MSDLSRQVGFWSAVAGAMLGLAYMLKLVVNLIVNTGSPLVDPYETSLHVIILLATPAIVIVWAAPYISAPAARQVFSLGSLALIIIYSALTSTNRYVAWPAMVPALWLAIGDGCSRNACRGLFCDESDPVDHLVWASVVLESRHRSG